MKIRIVLIGKIKNSSLKQEIESLLKRISRIELIELKEIKDKNTSLLQQKEYLLFKPYLEDKSYTSYLLTERGSQYTTRAFYEEIKKKQHIQFLISGAFGPCKELEQEVKHHLSLSKMIFTHEQACYMLVEQLYRVDCYNKNIPYTK